MQCKNMFVRIPSSEMFTRKHFVGGQNLLTASRQIYNLPTCCTLKLDSLRVGPRKTTLLLASERKYINKYARIVNLVIQ